MRPRFDGKTGRPLVPLTQEQLREHIRTTLAANQQWIRDQLPRRVRLRLAREHRIDTIASWLINHHQERAAILLWRLYRLW